MTPDTVDKSLTSLDWLRTLNPTALTQNIHSYHLATHSRNNSASIPSHTQYQQPQHHANMYHNNRQPQPISVQNGSGHHNDQPTQYTVNGIVDSTTATAAALADDASIEETLELMKAQVAQQEGRPSFSYSTLIAVAIKYNKKGKLTLGEIYQWIADNFPYYQTAGPSWKNSIRHNLSFNKLFIRVPREPNDPGKGAYWALNPNPATNGTSSLFSDLKDNGRKKRRKDDEGSGSLSPSSAPRSSVPPLASPKQQEPKLQQFPIGGQHFGSSVSNGQGTTMASSIAPLLHQQHQPQLPQAFGHFNDNFGQSLSLTTILYPQTQYNANASINGGILNFPNRDNFSQAAGIGAYPSQVNPPNNYAMFISNSQDPSAFGQFLNASNKNGLVPHVAPTQNTENIKRNGEMDAKEIAADALANLSFSNNQFMNMSHWNKNVEDTKAPSSKESSAKSHNPSQTSLISNKVKSVPVDDEEAYDYDTLID